VTRTPAIFITCTALGLAALVPGQVRADQSACPKDAKAPPAAVRAAYDQLAAAHQVSDAKARQALIEAALDTHLDGRAFGLKVLPKRAQAAVKSEIVNGWVVTLDALLRRKVLERLERPQDYRLKTRKVNHWCRDARVEGVLSRRQGRPAPRDVALRLAHRQGRWRIYDVAVDGSGLLASWRRHLSWAYRDDGVRGITRELKKLDDAARKAQRR